MDVPAEVKFKFTVQSGTVLLYRDDQDASGKKRLYVVLDYDVNRGASVVLVFSMTLVINHASLLRRYSQETLVDLTPADCQFLSKPSLFDCNRALERPIQVLIDKIEAGELLVLGEVSPEVLSKLRIGVTSSKLVSDDLKKKLRKR